MSEAFWIAIIEFSTKFGLDAALAIMNGVKSGKTIDDAIVALGVAQAKTAQQYIDAAKPASLTPP